MRRFPEEPVYTLADDVLPDGSRDELLGCVRGARVALADYPLILHDFPWVMAALGDAGSTRDAGTEPLTPQLTDRIDQWLLIHAGVLSQPQQLASAVNGPVEVTGEVAGFRPPGHGRGVVVPVAGQLGGGGPCGLLDLKGIGVAPGRMPSHALHSDGLEYLGVALGDYVIKCVVDRIFTHAGGHLHTLPVYAVLDLGVELTGGWNGTGPAGVHVRRAHRRLPHRHMHQRGSPAQQLAIEMESLLRQYGITSSTLGSAIRFTPHACGATIDFGYSARMEITGEGIRFRVGDRSVDPQLSAQDLAYLADLMLTGRELTIERMNLQLTEATGKPESSYHLYDFGHFNVRGRFQFPLASSVYDGPLGLGKLAWPNEGSFVQPVGSLLVDLDVMNRRNLNVACFALAARFNAGVLSRGDLVRGIDAIVDAACARWSLLPDQPPPKIRGFPAFLNALLTAESGIDPDSWPAYVARQDEPCITYPMVREPGIPDRDRLTGRIRSGIFTVREYFAVLGVAEELTAVTPGALRAAQYRCINYLGFIGFQLGETALMRVGCYVPVHHRDGTPAYYVGGLPDDTWAGGMECVRIVNPASGRPVDATHTNLWRGRFTGHLGVFSREDLFRPTVQTRVMVAVMSANLEILRQELAGSALTSQRGETASAVLAAMHLCGPVRTARALCAGGDAGDEDGNLAARISGGLHRVHHAVRRALARRHPWPAREYRGRAIVTANARDADALEALAQRVCLDIMGEHYGSLADELLWGGRIESMQAVELVAAILDLADVTFSAEDLSHIQTLRSLLAHARAGQPAKPADQAGPVAALGNRPAYVLRRREALTQWVCRTPLLRPRAPLDVDRFAAAVHTLVTRHEGLRLQVRRDGERWTEMIVPAQGLTPVEVIGLPAEPDQARARASATSAAAEIGGALTFPGELFKVVIVRRADGPDDLVVIAHHLLVDAISLGVIWHELEQVYLTEEPLARPTASLREFAVASQALRMSQADHDLSYWSSLPWSQVAPLFEAPGRERDSQYGTEWSTRGTERVLGTWTDRLTGREPAGAHRSSFAVAETMLTAFALALQDCTGRELLQIDLVVHGRAGVVPGVSVARTVGYLTETVPLFVRPDRSPDGRAALQEQLAHALTHGASHAFLRYLAGPVIAQRMSAWPRSEFSLNVVLPDLRQPVLSRFASIAGAPFALPREKDAHRVYAASSGMYARDGDLILGWDWGDAADDEFMITFVEACARWWKILNSPEPM